MLYIHPLYIDHNSLQLASRSRKIISNLCPTLSNIYETSSCPLKRRAHHDRRFDPTETNPCSVQGYRNSRTGFRDEPRKVAGRIVFHRCQAFLTSNRGAWQEDWILHGYRSDCATSFRQSKEGGGESIGRPLPTRIDERKPRICRGEKEGV